MNEPKTEAIIVATIITAIKNGINKENVVSSSNGLKNVELIISIIIIVIIIENIHTNSDVSSDISIFCSFII